MKSSIKNNCFKMKGILLLLSLLLITSCTDSFFDTNTDPNAATQEELGYDNLGLGSLITQMQYQMFPCIVKDQNVDVNNYQKMYSLAETFIQANKVLQTCLKITDVTIPPTI